jgi:hypothetical protein
MNQWSPFDDSLIDGVEIPGGTLASGSRIEEIKNLLAAKTTAVVRRRRRIRRAVRLGQFAAMYAVGFITAVVLSGGTFSSANAVLVRDPASMMITADGDSAAAVDASTRESPRSPDALDHVEPWELRQRVAGAPPEEQRRLLRFAGDQYLRLYSDVSGAVHCYRQFLELARPEDLENSDDDTWLLAELKLGRRRLSANL